MVQAVAPGRLDDNVPPAALVMLSMLVKLVVPTDEVPPKPLAAEDVRLTVAAARADRSRLSEPPPPLMLVTEPEAPKVKLSPLASPFRVLKPAKVSTWAALVTVPPLLALMAQAVAPVRLEDSVPPAALVMLSMLVKPVGTPTVEVPL